MLSLILVLISVIVLWRPINLALEVYVCRRARVLILVNSPKQLFWRKVRKLLLPSCVMSIESTTRFLTWYSNCKLDDPLDIIIYSDGGDIFSSDVILNCLMNHRGRVRTFVPYYACSAASLIALSGHELYMNHSSFLTPFDAQICPVNGEDHVSLFEMKELIKFGSDDDDSTVDPIGESYKLTAIKSRQLHEDNMTTVHNLFASRVKCDPTKKDLLIEDFTSGKHHHSKVLNRQYLESNGLLIHSVPEHIQIIFNSLVCLL